MIFAIMDIGSNTIRLSVYKQVVDKAVHLFSEKEQASLRNYVKKGQLTEKGIDRLISTLRKFKSIITNFDDIDSIHPFATATIRDVANRSEILRRVKDELDLDIEILSGEDEARLSFLGASKSVDVSEGVLTDIGGGSSEVVIIDQAKVIKSVSLAIGSLSAFNDFVNGLFTDKKEKKAIDREVKLLLGENKMYREEQSVLCAVGGSARASLIFYNEFYKLSAYNSTMNAKKFDKMLKEILLMPEREILDKILEVKADRVHTLIPGMVILNRLAKYFYVSEINISQTGVREGYVYSKLLERK